MSSERWQLLEALYHAALERKAEDRAAFLERVEGRARDTVRASS